MLLLALKLFVLIQPSLGYEWITLHDRSEIPDNLVTYADRWLGKQGVCKIYGFGGNIDWFSKYCFYGNRGRRVNAFPYEALVRNNFTEQMVWRQTGDINEIRKHGVEIKNAKNKEYVCAVEKLGVGKLIIWDNNAMECVIAIGFEIKIRKNILVLIAQPPSEVQLTNVKYHLDELKVLSRKPLHLADGEFINKGKKTRTVKETLTYGKSSESSWENSIGIEMGMSVSVEAGVPMMSKGQWQLSATATHESVFGKKTTEEISVSLLAEVAVPPKHRCKVRIVAKQFSLNVPYEATATAVFEDGKTSTQYISGVYDGVSVSRDTVKLDKCRHL